MPSRPLFAAVLFLCALGRCAATAQTAAPAAPASPLIEVKVMGKGAPIVFIPGLASPGSIWDEAVAHFQATHTCYVVSVAGFGGLPPVAKREHLLDDVRDAIIGFLRARKVEHPVIVGHSLGGGLALEIGSAAPDLPGGLVIVDSLPFLAALMGPGINTPDDARAMAATAGAQVAAQTAAQFAESERQLVAGMVTDPAKSTALATQMGKSDPATTGQAMTERMSRDLRPGLSAIKCPVLVLVALGHKMGGNMQDADVEAAYRAQYTKLPQARFIFFPRSRHFIMVDDPKGFDDALAKALDQPKPGLSSGTASQPSPAAVRGLDALAETQARKEAAQAHQVYLTCKLYASDNGGDFPEELGDVYPAYTESLQIFLSPFQPPVAWPDLQSGDSAANAKSFKDFLRASCAYEYSGGNVGDPDSKVFLRSKYPAPDGLRTVVYLDGRSDRVK